MLDRHRMLVRPLLGGIAFLSACEGSKMDGRSSPASKVEEAATPAHDGHDGHDDRDDHDAMPGANRVRVQPPRPPQLMPEDPSQLQRWKDSAEFEVTYETYCSDARGCLGFSIKLDQTGRLEFSGYSRVARPGRYVIEVGANEARALYENVLDQRFLQLQTFYQGISDGCDPSSSPQRMTLTIPDENKLVMYDELCRQSRPGYEQLLGIIDTYETWPPIQRFIRPEMYTCYEVDDTRFEKLVIEDVQTSWVIRSTEEEPLAILAFIEPPDVEQQSNGYAVRITNCQGEELLLSYSLSSYGCGFYMLPSDSQPSARLLEHELNAALLGVEKDRSQIPDDEWNLRLLDTDNETLLRLRRGDSCD